MEVLKYSVPGRPGAEVVNAGLEEEEGRVGAWRRSAPAPEGKEGDAPIRTLGPGTQRGPRLLEYVQLWSLPGRVVL